MEFQMELFSWCKYYSVNNDELDRHHKSLFDILNRLYASSLGDDYAKCLDPIIVELVLYSDYHIIEEEQYMRDVGYKEIDKHVLEHREFTQKILQLQQVADKDDLVTAKELIIFLGEWILNHIFDEDKNYAAP
jgi:hemerythrin